MCVPVVPPGKWPCSVPGCPASSVEYSTAGLRIGERLPGGWPWPLLALPPDSAP